MIERLPPGYRFAFFMLLRAPDFFSPLFVDAWLEISSAFRFCPVSAVPFTLTTVDFPLTLPLVSCATCASAVVQSADVSLIAYLRDGKPV